MGRIRPALNSMDNFIIIHICVLENQGHECQTTHWWIISGGSGYGSGAVGRIGWSPPGQH